MNELAVFKNIPVNTAAIASIYPDVKSANRKVAGLEKTGRIIRLKRGLYVVSPQESGILLSLNLIGNVLYGPSYVSMLTALREYGLIPERVDVVQSMTTHLTVSFENQAGRFEYQHCAKDYYPIGITQRQEVGVTYLIATPEKALCDYIISTPRKGTLRLYYIHTPTPVAIPEGHAHVSRRRPASGHGCLYGNGCQHIQAMCRRKQEATSH